MLSQQQLTLLAGRALDEATGEAAACVRRAGATAAIAAAAAAATAATASWCCCCCSDCCACWACSASSRASDSWRGRPAMVSTEAGSSVDMAVASSAWDSRAAMGGAGLSKRRVGRGRGCIGCKPHCRLVQLIAALAHAAAAHASFNHQSAARIAQLRQQLLLYDPPSPPPTTAAGCSSPSSSAVRFLPPGSACAHRRVQSY